MPIRLKEMMMIKYSILLVAFISLGLIGFSCKSDKEENKADQIPAHGEAKIAGDLTYIIPDEWIKEKPSSRMRKAQFRIPGQGDAADAEMALFVFPGSGGSVQANIDRWVDQFIQPDGSNSAEKTEIKHIESNGLPVTLVYLTGTHLKGTMGGQSATLPGWAMLAAIVQTSTDPWFFKAVGPQETIDYWRPAFESFAKTIKK
jgi:hypothetical protein